MASSFFFFLFKRTDRHFRTNSTVFLRFPSDNKSSQWEEKILVQQAVGFYVYKYVIMVIYDVCMHGVPLLHGALIIMDNVCSNKSNPNNPPLPPPHAIHKS